MFAVFAVELVPILQPLPPLALPVPLELRELYLPLVQLELLKRPLEEMEETAETAEMVVMVVMVVMEVLEATAVMVPLEKEVFQMNLLSQDFLEVRIEKKTASFFFSLFV
jgi:hypothetical protein